MSIRVAVPETDTCLPIPQAFEKNYPDIDPGVGSLKNVKISANDNTTINFPFAIVYDPSKDTDNRVLTEIASQCGLTSGSSSSGQLAVSLVRELHVARRD